MSNATLSMGNPTFEELSGALADSLDTWFVHRLNIVYTTPQHLVATEANRNDVSLSPAFSEH